MIKITNKNGFTLVELMVVIAIIGIIMAFALPAYNKQVIRAKRTEAQNILMELAAIQERHMAVYQQYATTILGDDASATNLGLSSSSKFRRTDDYAFSLTNDDGYTFRATARNGSSQRDDRSPLFPTNCRNIRINSTGRKWPEACW